MRVLLDSRMATWSGIGRYTVGLARSLASRQDVDLICAVAPADRPLFEALPGDGCEIRELTAHPFSVGGAVELGSLARDVRPDITHCPHFPTPFPAPHPLVVTLHDLGPLLIDGVMPSALKRAVYRRWNVRAVRVADKIICQSETGAADIVRMFPSASDRVRPVHTALDDFAWGPVDDLPEEIESWLCGDAYLFSMGNTKPHKGLDVLLRAFERLAPEHPSLRVILAGPDVPGFIDGVLGSSPVRSRARFSGAVDDASLRALYAGADVFVFPSLYEGFGLPPLEAMALGTAVVTTRAASLPEVVGEAAVLVSPGDAEELARGVARVLDDTAERLRLAEAGRRRAAEFTWDATAERTLAVYREATGTP